MPAMAHGLRPIRSERASHSGSAMMMTVLPIRDAPKDGWAVWPLGLFGGRGHRDRPDAVRDRRARGHEDDLQLDLPVAHELGEDLVLRALCVLALSGFRGDLGLLHRAADHGATMPRSAPTAKGMRQPHASISSSVRVTWRIRPNRRPAMRPELPKM